MIDPKKGNPSKPIENKENFLETRRDGRSDTNYYYYYFIKQLTS